MNLPNKISMARMLMLPLFLLFFLLDTSWGKLIAFIIFVIACFSDFLDGYIARKYNMVTDFGIFLDPIADKLLATTGLMALIVYGVIPNPYGIIFAFIMIARDYLVSGLRQIAAAKGKIIAADKVAKVKANFLYFSLIFGLFLAYLQTTAISIDVLKVLNIIFYVFVGITAVLITISCIDYLYLNREVLKDK